MTTQKGKAEVFRELHVKGSPVILFNIWDAGSAKAVAEAGAKAIATGSWSVAAAHGFADGEELPLAFAAANVERIVSAVDLPVTIDFETGYAADISGLKENVKQIIEAGAVGINFEDQIIGAAGLYPIDEQAARISAIREIAEQTLIPLFINARTDIFLKTYPAEHDQSQLDEAVARADAYARAGASGFFAPGLRNAEFIKQLADTSPIPINIMVLPDTPPSAELAALGAARISYGPAPFRQFTEFLKESARKAFAEISLEQKN